MKLVFFDDFTLGAVKDGQVIDLSEAVREVLHPTPQDLINEVIAHFQERYRARFEEALERGRGRPLEGVRLRSPLPRPGKIVAMAANYLEDGALKEPRPINAFLKSPESVIGHGDTVVLPPNQANIFHHEAELGIVIGKEAVNVRAADAYDHIFGYVNFIDVSARGLGGVSFYWGKSWDTFGPLGPFLVTADEVPDPQALQVQLRVNGDPRQDYNTGDMGHKIPRTVEWASSIVTLEPGDLIACGTNHQGLGALQDQDHVDMEIQGLGTLHVHVQDDLKREWPRGVDTEIADWVAGRASTGPSWTAGRSLPR
jgi:2-keto-4-pentenoate hydratase/2-oxohepta-3-ene-1,7-dioic acid hydratase in catechol pathway